MIKTLIFLILTYSAFLFPQNDEQFNLIPPGLSLSNQLEYSYDYKKDQYILEDWFNLDYRYNIFSAGIRFVAFQPNDPNPGINRGKEKFAGIDYKYIKAEFGSSDKGLEVTAGNFYSLFSYGMVLKSYEDRNIRVDNNLLGIKLNARYGGFNLTALSGSAETVEDERRDILHAADIEYTGFTNFKIGATQAINIPFTEGAPKTSLTSFRVKPTFGNIDLYAEYGIKNNEQIESQISSSTAGKGFYGSGSFYAGSFSLIGEYKFYDNFAFTSSDGSIIYNTPPAVRRDYTYSLLNRHPSPLNQNNEQGFQIEGNYFLTDNTFFNASYGVTKTLPSSSFYQRVNNSNLEVRTQLEEIYFQANHQISEKLNAVLAFGYNEEFETGTKNITPIVEAKYYLDDVNTIRLIFEHQQTKNIITNEEYFTDLVLFEFLHSPDFSIAIAGEMQTKEPVEGRKIRPTWKFIQTSFQFDETTNLSLLIGSRQAGNICVGGICRFEPEFNGVELKMLTRF